MGWGYNKSAYYIFGPWCDEINFCCFICVTQWWAVHVVIFAVFTISVRRWHTTTYELRKQTDAIWKFYFRFRFWTFYCHRHVILHRSNKFHPNWTLSEGVITLCRFFKMAAVWRSYRRKSTFAFWFYDVMHLGSQRTICIPKFDQISQSTATILLLPVFSKRTAAILTFYFRFRFWPFHCHWHVVFHRHTYSHPLLGVLREYFPKWRHLSL